MEISIDRNEFFNAVSRVQSIIEKRSNMPILSTILISAINSDITITATDLEISLQQKLTAEVIEPGNITISGRKLFEIIKESKSPLIHIKEKENNWVSILADNAKYNLACLPADEFPIFVEPEGVTKIEIDGDKLREMIAKTIYSVTMEEAGFKLSGIFTEKIATKGMISLRMVATDGHRLSMIDKEINNIEDLIIDGGVMIPKKGMLELNKLAAEGGVIHFGFKQNNCVAHQENTLIVIRLLESKFPDYNAVIPRKTKHHIKIDRNILLDGMKKMTILSSESYRGVKLTVENNNMELSSINPDLGDARENIKIEYDAEPLNIGFNTKYFIDILQSMDSETVELGFSDSSSPCVIQGDKDQGFLGLIMPMRL